MYLLSVIIRFLLFPIGSESSDKLLPVNQTAIVSIEHVSNFLHFKSIGIKFSINDAVNKIVPRNKIVVILIHFSEQVSESGLLMIHELQEALPPFVPYKVISTFLLPEVSQMVVQKSLSFPGQHPNVAPFVPQKFYPWALELRFGAWESRSIMRQLRIWAEFPGWADPASGVQVA